MADRINEQNYETMISALQQYASRIHSAVENMQGLGNACIQAIGDDDKAVSQIVSNLRGCEIKYEKAAKEALNIAKAMQEELEQQRQEDQVWNSED